MINRPEIPNPDPITYEVGDRVKLKSGRYRSLMSVCGTVTREYIYARHKDIRGKRQIEVDWDDGTHTAGIFTEDFEKVPEGFIVLINYLIDAGSYGTMPSMSRLPEIRCYW